MLDLLPADIFGEVLAFFALPEPHLFGISVATRAAAITHFARRRPDPSWFSVNIRAALLCHPAAALAEVMIIQRGPIRVSQWSLHFRGWQFWFDNTQGIIINNWARPRLTEGIHPSIALIAQESRYHAFVQQLDTEDYRFIYECGDGIVALYAFYARVLESNEWELAAALEQRCDIDVAVRRINCTQYSKWISQQVTLIQRDDVHAIARLRRYYRGSDSLHDTILSDRKMFDIAAKYGCWRIARHLIEVRMLPYFPNKSYADSGIHLITARSPEQARSRAFINTNKMIKEIIDKAR